MTFPAEKLDDVAAVLAHNQVSLDNLQRAIALGRHSFSLLFAPCNYQRLQNLLVEYLQQKIDGAQVLTLQPTTDSLYRAIAQPISPTDQPPVLLVKGLDHVQQLPQVLAQDNLVRDNFRQFQFPVVFWLNEYSLQQFSRYAPDFVTYATRPGSFAYPANALVSLLHQSADQLFAQTLQTDSDRTLPNPAIALQSDSQLSSELEFALSDLATTGRPLDAELQACLDFVRGREAHAQLEMDTARERYERSLRFWQRREGEGGRGEGREEGAKLPARLAGELWAADQDLNPHPPIPPSP
ncbi:MAG: hypothetical protein ACTS3T_01270, partial [Almyronema sp.]